MLPLLLFFAYVEGFAWASSWLARKQGHSGTAWFFVGGIFGPLALIALSLLQDGHNESVA